jgi:hypothetical protein
MSPQLASIHRKRLALAAMIALAGCEGVQEPAASVSRPVLSAAVVSNPVSAPPSAGPALSGSASEAVVYVSLPPGSAPGAEQVTIRHPRTGALRTVAMVEGGFDPIGVEANAGDTLDLDIRVAGANAPLLYAIVVPDSRPPVVVRTDPPPQKRDVPLNAVLLVVFSEPLDAASLTPTSVQLLQAGVPVAGAVGFADEAHLAATFTPAAPLEPDAEYTLRVPQGIRDLDGDPLEAAVSVTFTTEDALRGKIAFVKIFVNDSLENAGLVNYEIYVMDADGSNPVNLTNHPAIDAGLAVSPDGTKIAFSTRRGDGDLDVYVMNADGSNPVNLTKHPAEDVGPVWSPDGMKIAFSRGGQYGGQIYVMNADGSNPVNLSNEPESSDFTPAWSPDGTKIAFSRYRQIYVMDADGSNPVNLTNDPNEFHFAPTWSPDGTKIAFTKSVTESLDYEVFVMNADGSDPVNLTNNPDSYDWWPAWSPDGTQIAFASRRDGNDEVYVMNADGSNPVNLTNDPDWQDWLPAWSPE